MTEQTKCSATQAACGLFTVRVWPVGGHVLHVYYRELSLAEYLLYRCDRCAACHHVWPHQPGSQGSLKIWLRIALAIRFLWDRPVSHHLLHCRDNNCITKIVWISLPSIQRKKEKVLYIKKKKSAKQIFRKVSHRWKICNISLWGKYIKKN